MAPSTSYLTVSSVFFSLLSAAVAADPSSASSFTDSTSGIVFQRFSSPQDANVGVALPQTSSDSFIGQLSVPLSNGAGWGALGLTGSIEDGVFVAAYPDGKGGVTASLRNADQSEVSGDFKIRTISQTVDQSSLLYTFLCQSCLGTSTGVNSLSSTLGFGISNVAVADPTSSSTPLGLAVAGNGTFTVDLAAARSAEFDAVAAKAASQPAELKKRDLSDLLSSLTGGAAGNVTGGAGDLLSKLGSLLAVGGSGNAAGGAAEGAAGGAAGGNAAGGLTDLLGALQSKSSSNATRGVGRARNNTGATRGARNQTTKAAKNGTRATRKNKTANAATNGTRTTRKNKTAKAGKNNTAAAAKNAGRSIDLPLEERDELPILERGVLEARKNGTKKNGTRASRKNKTTNAAKNGTRATRKNKTAKAGKNNTAASKKAGRAIFERQNRSPPRAAANDNNNNGPDPAANNNNGPNPAANNAPAGPPRYNRIQQVRRFVEEFLAKRAILTEEDIFGDEDEDDF